MCAQKSNVFLGTHLKYEIQHAWKSDNDWFLKLAVVEILRERAPFPGLSSTDALRLPEAVRW